MTSIHMTSLQDWITPKIIIIVMAQPSKTVPIKKKTEQPMKMSPDPTQPMNMASDIPPHPLSKIFQIIMLRRRWMTTL